jgi:thiamine-phosphate pyrophosphorylase
MKGARVDDVERACVAVAALCRRAGALVLVHTHAHLVARCGLHGAHLDARIDGQRARVDEARLAMPRGALLGCSRHAGDRLDREALAGFDYATLSPVFAPRSKPDDTRAPLGLAGLASAVRASSLPVIALGGVDASNARTCIDHGARGVAVLGAIMSAHDPHAALALMRAELS